MFFLEVNQPAEGLCTSQDTTIAHELWHISGAPRHDATEGEITACTGEGVADLIVLR